MTAGQLVNLYSVSSRLVPSRAPTQAERRVRSFEESTLTLVANLITKDLSFGKMKKYEI